jgi:hypothetical protein
MTIIKKLSVACIFGFTPHNLINGACLYDDGASSSISEYGGDFPFFFSGTTYNCQTYGVTPLFTASSWSFTGVCNDGTDDWGFITSVDGTDMLQTMLY